MSATAPASGTVYLVGAGPGDPDLITVRGAELLSLCDVVVYDRLAPIELLSLVPAHACRIDVGKRPRRPGPGRQPRVPDEAGGDHAVMAEQDRINALLVEHARAGRSVVRLKGGDPFVFGRGAEEAQALAAAGIPFEIVPGVTAAVAVPAYAGIPVTSRGTSESVTVVTGHGEDGEPGVEWEKLAAVGGTIVVLMGVTHRTEIARRLMAGGLSAGTPVATIRYGSRSYQETRRTNLGELDSIELHPPATIVIGAVAGINLSWFETKPLIGWKVVVCRAGEQAPALSSALRRLGALVVGLPVIAFEPPEDGGAALAEAVSSLSRYEWAVFTSANGARRFIGALDASGRDVRALGVTKVAAIGPGTAAVLRSSGVVADLVPQEFVAEALVSAFPEPGSPGGRMLVCRAAQARDTLPKGLEAMGWNVDVVPAYRTVRPPVDPAGLGAAKGSHAIAFTSPSTVTGFLDAAGHDSVPPVVACIGPITADAARAAALQPAVVAQEHTVEGLAGALAAYAASHERP